MIPFFFTRYRKAPLATCCSFLSSMCYLCAVLFSVGYFLNWSGLKDESSLGESLLVAAVFAVLGFGLMKLAEWLAVRKQKKLAAKETPAAPATPGPSRTRSACRACPKCGATVEEDDVFCVNCGAKL